MALPDTLPADTTTTSPQSMRGNLPGTLPADKPTDLSNSQPGTPGGYDLATNPNGYTGTPEPSMLDKFGQSVKNYGNQVYNNYASLGQIPAQTAQTQADAKAGKISAGSSILQNANTVAQGALNIPFGAVSPLINYDLQHVGGSISNAIENSPFANQAETGAQNIMDKYNSLSPETQANIGAGAGLITAGVGFLGGGEAGGELKGAVGDVLRPTEESIAAERTAKVVKGLEEQNNALKSVGNSHADNTITRDGVTTTPLDTVAKYNLPVVVNEGTIDTTGAGYKIDNIVRDLNSQLDTSLANKTFGSGEINTFKTDSILNNAITAAKNSTELQTAGLVQDTVSKLQKIFSDYKQTYGPNIDLQTLNEIRKSVNNKFNPETTDAQRIIGNVTRDKVYNAVSDGNIKANLRQQGELLSAKNYLEKVQGTKAKGGKVGGYAFGVGGAIAGAGVDAGLHAMGLGTVPGVLETGGAYLGNKLNSLRGQMQFTSPLTELKAKFAKAGEEVPKTTPTTAPTKLQTAYTESKANGVNVKSVMEQNGIQLKVKPDGTLDAKKSVNVINNKIDEVRQSLDSKMNGYSKRGAVVEVGDKEIPLADAYAKYIKTGDKEVQQSIENVLAGNPKMEAMFKSLKDLTETKSFLGKIDGTKTIPKKAFSQPPMAEIGNPTDLKVARKMGGFANTKTLGTLAGGTALGVGAYELTKHAKSTASVEAKPDQKQIPQEKDNQYNNLLSKYFTPKELPVMKAIMLAESNATTTATNTNTTAKGKYKNTQDGGLFQINDTNRDKGESVEHFRERMKDPEENLAMAEMLAHNHKGLSNWATYTSGKYKQFLYKKI